MKTTDVPQEQEKTILAGYQRACYAVDEQGRYVVVGSVGWEVEQVVNGQANDEVRAAIAADPAFAGEQTGVFAVAGMAGLGACGHGVLLGRRATGGHGGHPALVFEGRFDPTLFAARVMLDGARRLPQLAHGGHRYSLEFTPARSSSSRPR